jgi:hypothetical protein
MDFLDLDLRRWLVAATSFVTNIVGQDGSATSEK